MNVSNPRLADYRAILRRNDQFFFRNVLAKADALGWTGRPEDASGEGLTCALTAILGSLATDSF